MRRAALLAGAVVCGWTVLAAQSDQWRSALPGYTFEFPRDHASHRDYKLEWWYYTGNLADAGGRRFGYQLTFFRVGVDPAPSNPSRWTVRDLFMTHLAVTDVDGRRFHVAERLNRAGVEWAGAESARYRVWNEDWEASLDEDGNHRLQARDGDIGIALVLRADDAPVVHGRDGVSQKGDAAGNASHYYSLTRMETTGVLDVGGRSFDVQGSSWMDHEFGTSFLEAGQVGWNWFALQLDDDSELMVYEFLRRDGRRDAHSSGTIVGDDGQARRLAADDVRLEPLGDTWRSEASGGDYPIAWRVAVPSAGLDVTVRAVLPDQELVIERSGGVAYWEGAVVVDGTKGDRGIAGRGYLEMTGYAGRSIAEALQ